MLVEGIPRDNIYRDNDGYNDEAASDKGMPGARK